MITFTKGNILLAEAEAIVNTVNTVGIMGKGIALQFKEFYPDNYNAYRSASDKELITIGKMFVTETHRLGNPKYIINFPTKKHWKEKSRYEYVTTGLDDLIRVIRDFKIKSIAIPPLGCGNGGLDWIKVKKILLEKLQAMDSIDVHVFEPTLFVEPVKVKIINKGLTPARAMVLNLMARYQVLGFEVSLLEIQKLAYFLQRFGEPLKLKYEKALYGPYANNLVHVLKALENSYIQSKTKIADSKPFSTIRLAYDKFEEVNDYVDRECSAEQKERLEKVSKLIEGFESPFGMELLATVDYVMSENKSELDSASVIKAVQFWNARKRKLMSPDQVISAYSRLSKFQPFLNNQLS